MEKGLVQFRIKLLHTYLRAFTTAWWTQEDGIDAGFIAFMWLFFG